MQSRKIVVLFPSLQKCLPQCQGTVRTSICSRRLRTPALRLRSNTDSPEKGQGRQRLV
jgi:hypothetical protein